MINTLKIMTLLVYWLGNETHIQAIFPDYYACNNNNNNNNNNNSNNNNNNNNNNNKN